MNHPISHPFTRATAALLAAVVVTGCQTAAKHGTTPSRDRTFIYYYPPPEGSTALKLAVKDNIDMEGVVTTAGSEYLLKNSKPANKDAACLDLARKRGVWIVGKVNLSEFAVSPSGINDYFGTPINPLSGWRKWIPGGSSCGSALAVATERADIAFGTDTAGSIRVPAACCGVIGLKTTFGLVPLDGVFPIDADHLDTVGPLARNLPGVVQGMDLLQEGFAKEYAAAEAAIPTPGVVKVGRLRLRGTDKRIDRAVDEALEKAGFQVVELGANFRTKWEQAHHDGTAVAAAGAWLSDRKYSTKTGVTARTKSVIAVGAVAYATQYKKAMSRRDDWQRALRAALDDVDFIALPTLQGLPPRIPPTLKIDLFRGKAKLSYVENTLAFNFANPITFAASVPSATLRLVGIDTLEADMLKLQNTVAVNFAGNPALALPIPLHGRGLPITSVQLIGPPRSEAELLAAARFIEMPE